MGGLMGATAPKSLGESDADDLPSIPIGILFGSLNRLSQRSVVGLVVDYQFSAGFAEGCDCSRGSGVAHSLDLVDGINMDEDQNTVYRILHFSVDFEENPMFMRVKPLSLLVYQDELGEELDLRTAVDLAVVDPAVDHGVPFGLADA
jgi:hypothetical protein